MKDLDCVAFLQSALPRLGLRWRGFRQVRGQVCKRIDRRIRELGLPDVSSYTTYLDANPNEWRVLDALCTVSISRFYRDRVVFDYLRKTVLPVLAAQAVAQPAATIHCWSAGCASGEEPYTLSLIWGHLISRNFPQLAFSVVATDVDGRLLERARDACYPPSSLRELPPEWIDAVFIHRDAAYRLRDEWKSRVEFRQQDMRTDRPSGPFDLVLCRNVAFTYFDEASQRGIINELTQQIPVGGFLIIGRHECVPPESPFLPYAPALGIFRRAA